MQKRFHTLLAPENRGGNLRPAAGASVTVTDPNGALATIYSDNGVTVAANPLTSSATGYYEYYAADGRYTETIVKAGRDTVTISDILLEDPADSPSPTSADIASTADSKGAGLVGFSALAEYAAGTVGKWLVDLKAAAGSALVGFLQSGTGAVERTVQDKLRESVSVKDFGAVGDGTTDDTDAGQAAIDAVFAAGGGIVFLPAGTYKANWTLKKGVILQGAGRGQDAAYIGGVPQSPTYEFVGGGTSIIPADAAIPVLQGIGSTATDWVECSIRDLKISNTSLVAGSIGIFFKGADNIQIENVEVRSMDIGIQMRQALTTGGVWGYKLDHVSITDCGQYGLYLPDSNADTTPVTLFNVDIRRCTGVGAYLRDLVALAWFGGTITDCAIGMKVLGSSTYSPSFYGVMFETNFTRQVVIGEAGEAPKHVSFYNCAFFELRGSPYAGSVAVECVTGQRINLINCTWKGYETCFLNTTGSGTGINVQNPHLSNCTQFGTVDSVELASFIQAHGDNTAGVTGYTSKRFRAKCSDTGTYANNFYVQSSGSGSTLSGTINTGTSKFAQWAVHAGSDPDNAHYVALEVSTSYTGLFSNKRGTGVIQPMRIGTGGNNQIKLGAAGELGFFNSDGVVKPSVSGSVGGNVALANLINRLALLGLISDATTA